MPSRPALVTIASGDRPVSKSSRVVTAPRRTLTSAENSVLGHEPDGGGPRLELRRLDRAHAERGAGGALVARQQGVEDVVDERGDHDLVDWLQGHRVDRRPRGGTRDGHGDLPRIVRCFAHRSCSSLGRR